MAWRRRTGSALGLAAVAGLSLALAPAAHADIMVAATVAAAAPRTDLDIALVNANLGTRQALPGSVNTAADEFHPRITPDSRRLVFQRREPDGSVRVIAVDLRGGAAADLFTPAEAAERPPDGTAITADGATVMTGGPFAPSAGGTVFVPEITVTDLRSFPAPAFPHGALRPPGLAYPLTGQLTSVVAGGDGLVAGVMRKPGTLGEIVLISPRGGTSVLSLADAALDHPAIAASAPQVVVFDTRPLANGLAGPGDIAFRPSEVASFAGTPTPLPTAVNSVSDESQPSLTRNGRYLAFVRHDADGHDRVLVWDSQTQLVVEPRGADLGAVITRHVGGTSAFERRIVTASELGRDGRVIVRLARAAPLGLVVQRVTRFETIFGALRPVVRPAGRVSFGRKRAGRVREQWNGRVLGRFLRPGLYQVTVRALSARGRVRDLGRPTIVRLGRGGRIVAVVGRA